MSWVIDIILVVIVATVAYIGYKKGIVKMLMSLLTVILSFGLSFVLSGPLARWFYSLFFEKGIGATVDAALESQTTHTANDAIGSLLGEKGLLGGLTKLLGFDPSAVSIATAGGSIEQIAQNVKNDLIAPAMILLLQILLFLLLFALCWILLGIAANAICRLAKKSTVRGANAIFGGLTGMILGFLLAGGVCLLFNLWLQINPNGLFGITAAVRDDSVLYHLIDTYLFTLG